MNIQIRPLSIVFVLALWRRLSPCLRRPIGKGRPSSSHNCSFEARRARLAAEKPRSGFRSRVRRPRQGGGPIRDPHPKRREPGRSAALASGRRTPDRERDVVHRRRRDFRPVSASGVNAGDYVLVPKTMRHFGWAKTPVVVQIHGIGPFKQNTDHTQRSRPEHRQRRGYRVREGIRRHGHGAPVARRR
jgi:hypothetical protein